MGEAWGLSPAYILAVVLVLALFAVAGEARCDENLQGRMKALARSKGRVSIKADKVEYDRKTGIYTATGNVRIAQGTDVLTADRATLSDETGDAEASGHARLVSQGNTLTAESIKVNFNTSLGVISEGKIFLPKENYHIEGKTLKKVSEGEYLASSGKLTTCDAESPFWSVSASSLDVRMDRDLTARDAVLRIEGIPVLYTPYAWFPLLKPRTSGFLIPGFGYSTRQGTRLAESYYWAPLDNFDTTVHLDYRSRRGFGISDETNYAYDKDSSTSLGLYYMDDHLEKNTRYNVVLKHQQTFTPSLSGRLDLNLSDSQFYRDLADTAKERTQRSMDSDLFLTNRWDWGRAYFFTQYTQGLDLFNNKIIVQRLPEAGFNVLKKQVAGFPLYLDLDSSVSNFSRKTDVTGQRADVFPKLTGFFSLGGLNFTPRIGYRETAYSLRGNQEGFDDERGLFGAGVKAQTDLDRLYTFKGGPLEGIRHTIEPSAAYDYVAVRGGSDFAKFDDIDTYGRRNLVAYSLTNRFVIKYRKEKDKAEARVDYLTIKLSQFYDLFKDNRVTGVPRSLSNLYGSTVYKAGSRVTVNNDFRYDVYRGRLDSINTDVRYEHGSRRWHVSLGQRFSNDTEQVFMSPSRFDFFTPSTDFVSGFLLAARTAEQEFTNFVTFEGGANISSRWTVGGRVWYDVHNRELRDIAVNVIYSAQCWSLSGNFVKTPRESQYLLVLALKGLGSVKL